MMFIRKPGKREFKILIWQENISFFFFSERCLIFSFIGLYHFFQNRI